MINAVLTALNTVDVYKLPILGNLVQLNNIDRVATPNNNQTP